VWDITETKDERSDPRSAMVRVIKTFLGRPDYWMTFTFRNAKTTAIGATEALRSWLSCWGRRQRSSLAGRSACQPISQLIWCVEMQLRGTAHIHALGVSGAPISGAHCVHCYSRTAWNPNWPTWRILKESWYVHSGIARIFPYDDARGGGVAAYVAKYMYKGPDSQHGLWEAGKDY
jgi:hypothetical protein